MASKIDKHELGPEVIDLSFNQGKSDTDIARILTEKGFAISQSTVSRWLEKKREEHGPKVQEILDKHAEEQAPKDLDAIETMQALAYTWANEEPDTTVDRITAQARVLDALPEWREKIMHAEGEKAQAACMEAIVKDAAGWVVDDFNTRRARCGYIKTARELIEVKLRYSGAIENEERGKIVIKTRPRDPEGAPGPEGQGRERKGKVIRFKGNPNGA